MTSTLGKTAAYLAAALHKLRFLRGRCGLLVLWPAIAIAVGVTGWSVLLSSLDAERQQLELNALREANALARSYADHLTRTMEVVDQILLHVKYEWELSNGTLRLEKIKDKGLFLHPSFFNVAIVGRDGKLLTSGTPNKAGISVEDRPFFAAHKGAAKDFLHIMPPVVGRVSNNWVILFSRGLAAKDGSFDGVAVVSVVPEYFTAYYDEASLGENGFLGIVGSDNIVRATRIGNSVNTPNFQPLVSVPRFQSESASALMNGNTWFSDKRSRYVGWSKVEGYPLTTMSGLDQQAVLAPYWAGRASAIREAVWATVALAVFAVIAMALSILLAWRKQQLELTQTTYRIATEGGSEGFYIARPIHAANGSIVDFEVVDCNHRGAEFLRQRREELIGKRVSTLYNQVDSRRLMGMLRQAEEAGFYESDEEVPGASALMLQWVHVKVVRSDGELAITLRDISETKAHVEELERRGNEDALTGLTNRHWLQAYLPNAIERAAANHSMLSLLFIDLDGFKAVNDTMGHSAGDELLRNAARRLEDAVRPHDHVVRLGGDEFLVIIENIAHKMDAAHVAERILHAFEEGFRLPQGMSSVGTSIGISIFPSDGADAEALLRHADVAMYSVKTGGKRNYRFYDQKFYDALRTRLERESELREAIERDQFVMYYQPRVDIVTGTTSSMEALVRWAHPSKGLLEPLAFIPLAEETGLILGLGERVIDHVCAQLADWAKSCEQLVPVSVNVSPRQFNQGNVAAIFSTRLAIHGVDPSLVEIELTESSMMGDNPDVADALTAIRRMGIKLLVDDFGTGYSSLSQLQRLDFDVLKVDQAFTAEIEGSEKGQVFFKAIITMAHALGMRVVAEGVENERQIKILKSLCCDEIQGFYISAPLPPSEKQPILPKWFFPSTA
jgi:diguanylate cyclase (GGDEF)-like protein